MSRACYFASSMTVCGHPARLPVSEDEAPRPLSYYGISKYAAERFVMATAARPDLAAPFRATAFRMFNVYGERQRLDNPTRAWRATSSAWRWRARPSPSGTGEQSRDFAHIDDVADAWLAAIDAPATFNPGVQPGRTAGAPSTIWWTPCWPPSGRDRADYPLAWGRAALATKGTWRPTRIACAAIGWTPRVGFTEGMARTVAWAGRQLAVEASRDRR
ncbi:MAG: NAD-dependent epimerase/dehydratase family protein [Anaerolineae bacterium]|nr:NAD-dependent epimerase/dehydratase family protein [Anaerolineae bacterium]